MQNKKNAPRFVSRLLAVLAVLAALLTAFAVTPAFAVAYYWDCNTNTTGFGTLNAASTWANPTAATATNGWSTGGSGNLALSAVTTTTNDAINFGADTSGNGLGGSTLTVAGTVEAASIKFGSQTTGNILLTGGTINFTNNPSIQVGAGGSTMHTIASAITGAAGGLTKANGSLTFSGANTYSGGTFINGGALVFRNTGAKPASGTHAFAANTTLGLGVAASGSFFTSVDVDNAFAGSMVGNLSDVTVNATTSVGIDTTAGNFNYSTSVAGSPTRGMVKYGANTLTLSGANTWVSNTTIFAGTLRLENTNAVQNSSLIAVGANTLQLATDTAFAQGSGTALTIAGGTVVSDRATAGPGLTHAFAGNFAVSHATHNFTKGTNVTSGDAAIQVASMSCASGSGGTATFNPTTANFIIAGTATGAAAGIGNYALAGSAASNSIGGNITLGTRGTNNIVKSGASVWTLSGDNNTDGTEGLNGTNTVTGGALIATTRAALPNTKAGGSPSYSRVIFNGGTIGARVGGAGWSTAEVDALVAGATKTSGQLGIDTSNGDLTQWTDVTAASLGTLGLAKLGTGTLTLNSAANNFTGTTLVSQGTLKLDVDHTLSGGLTFGYANGTTSATGILDLNAVNATFSGGLNVDGNSTNAYEIQIDPTKTLTVSNALQIGATTPGVSGTVTKLAMTGLGGFTHNGSTFLVGGNAASASLKSDATLDLTALTNTTITTSGNFSVAPNTPNNNGSSSTLLLPTPAVADTVATTDITSGGTNGISVGNRGGNNGSASVTTPMNTLQLGTGLTRLNAAKINVGAEPTSTFRDVGQLIYGQAAGDLIIRAADGASRAASINLGTLSAGVQTTAAFANSGPVLLDVSGHDADILVTNLNLGGGLNRTAAVTYQFKFGVGDQVSMASKLDATSVNLGNRSAGNSQTTTHTAKVDLSGGTVTFGNAGATGTGVDIGKSAYDQAGAATFDSQLNISGGNVTIYNGSGGFAVRLGTTAVAANATNNSSMNLTGGTTTLTGDIIQGAYGSGTLNSTLTLNGASAILDLGGNDITNLTSITYTAGTLKNLGVVNTGLTLAGTGARVFDQGSGTNGTILGPVTGPGVGLTKTGLGTLAISGTNTYTGNTTVSNGTLAIAVASIDTNSTVSVTSGAVLQLGFAETNMVTALVLNGVTQAAGVYSSNNAPTYITGPGSLEVVSIGPVYPPATLLTNSITGGGTNLSLSWPAGQGWRLQEQTNSRSVGLRTNWVYVTDNSVSSTNITVDKTKPTTFYRLVYP